MEGHRRKVVGVSIASIAALLVKAKPALVGAALAVYLAWWMHRHARSKRR